MTNQNHREISDGCGGHIIALILYAICGFAAVGGLLYAVFA